MVTNGFKDRDRKRPVRLLYGYDVEIAEWVADELNIDTFGKCRAIAAFDESGIIAGVVYHNYRSPLISMEMTIASVSPKWANKRTIRAFFDYPFSQIGLARVTSITDVENQHSVAFQKRLGFKQEGLIRQGYENGNDAVLMGMLRKECKWV